MKLTKPYFYDKFICTADHCSDNCCIGWEIDIDDTAMERYKNAEGEFGCRLRKAIHERDGVHTFAFGEGERCALLREDGLCELILNMGEDSLCDICALHPRFFGWYNGLKEAGLGLCCEEVCRLLFENSEPLHFVSGEIDEEWEENCSQQLLDELLAAREELYKILQNRQNNLRTRLFNAAEYARMLETALENAQPLSFNPSAAPQQDSSETISALLELLQDMESINAEWDELLTKLIRSKNLLCTSLPEFFRSQNDEMWRYEHIAVYFCYRYFLGLIFLCNPISRIGLMCVGVLTTALADCLTWLENGELSEADRINNLKLISKQIEYSEENVELVYDEVWITAQLSPERISLAFGE